NLLSPFPYVVYVPFQVLAEHLRFAAATAPSVFTARLGGVMFAVAQLGVTWALARRMCPRGHRVEVLLVAVAANLVPQLRFIHGYVNADAMTILAATACFAVALRVLDVSLSSRASGAARVTLVDASLLGLAIALAALSHYNAFGAALVAF